MKRTGRSIAARSVAAACVAGLAAVCLAVAPSVAVSPVAGENGRPGENDRTEQRSRAAQPGQGDQLGWEKCADPDAARAGVRCAEFDVPADWRESGGERVTLAVAKLPAERPAQRLGSLLVNTGGPGPTIPSLYQNDRLHELTAWFDVIALEPRGIGASSPITCPAAPKYVQTMVAPDQRTWQKFTAANRTWEEACLGTAGPLAGNLDSWQVAHDMDAIRNALGEDRLRYYGNSYGTVYGQAYAELFPGKVGRLFLDSALDHGARSTTQVTAPMAELIDDKFRDFGQWCERSTDCALHPENGREVWDHLMVRAAREPLPAPGAGQGKTVGADRLRFATLGSVDSPAGWPGFAEALAQARSGDASALHVGAEDLPPNRTAAYLASCSDFPFAGDWSSLRRMEHDLREIAPRVGWLMGRMQYARCAGMQRQGSFPPHRIEPEDLPSTLLVSGLADDTTPPEHGRSVAAQLPGSVWVGADSDHAVYLDGNACVRELAHRYLRTGALPAPGTSCPAD